MFDKGPPSHANDFRPMLYLYLKWDDSTNTLDEDRLSSLSDILGYSKSLIRMWIEGRARPSATTELFLISHLRSLLSAEGLL